MLANALNSKNITEKKIAHSVFKILPHLVYDYEFYLTHKIIDSISKKNCLSLDRNITEKILRSIMNIYYLIITYKIINLNYL